MSPLSSFITRAQNLVLFRQKILRVELEYIRYAFHHVFGCWSSTKTFEIRSTTVLINMINITCFSQIISLSYFCQMSRDTLHFGICLNWKFCFHFAVFPTLVSRRGVWMNFENAMNSPGILSYPQLSICLVRKLTLAFIRVFQGNIMTLRSVAACSNTLWSQETIENCDKYRILKLWWEVRFFIITCIWCPKPPVDDYFLLRVIPSAACAI